MEKLTTIWLKIDITEGEAQTLELTDYVPDWVFYERKTTVALLPPGQIQVSKL